MIRVEIDREVSPGVWEWVANASGGAVGGRSRQPLLDACRVLKRMGENPGAEIGLFWPGQPDFALRTTVGHGAGLTVADPASGRGGVQFHEYRAMEPLA